MTKGIIVVNIPEKCEYCPCYVEGYVNGSSYGDSCKFTGERLSNYTLSNYMNEKHCPFKLLPEKQVRDYPEYDRYITGYDDGWDACIDEILGE